MCNGRPDIDMDHYGRLAKKSEQTASLDSMVLCPECGAETFVDTDCVASDHPELTMELDFCTKCDWSGNDRPPSDTNERRGS